MSTAPLNNEVEQVIIHLTPQQYNLATNYQDTYEKLFNKYLSLEELFKTALFFSLITNKQKIAILKSYKHSNNNSLSNKTNTKQITKTSIENTAVKTANTEKQAKLGGF